MGGIHLPPAISIGVQSSAPTPRTDRLHGSLGLYLVLCGLVLVLIIGSAILLWRIHGHRRTGQTPSNSIRDREELRQYTADRGLDLQLPTVSYSPDGTSPINPKVGFNSGSSAFLKLPASLCIRSPVRDQLKFFMTKVTHGAVGLRSAPDGSAQGALPHVLGGPPTPVVPSIVISECSPVIPSPTNGVIPTTASLSSSLISSSSASSDSLRIPGSEPPRLMAAQLQVDGNSPLKKKSFGSRRTAPNKSDGKAKATVRSPTRRGKENAPPARFKGRVYDMSQETKPRGTGPLGFRFP